MAQAKQKKKKINISRDVLLSYGGGIAILLLIAYFFGIPAWQKARFEKQDKQAYEYIQKINSKYPGIVSRDKYCDFSSAKFEKGPLGCSVETQVHYYDLTESDISEIAKYTKEMLTSLNWGKYTQSKGYAATSTDNRSVSYIFRSKHGCGVDLYVSTTGMIVSSSCSGSARKEYYPVK